MRTWCKPLVAGVSARRHSLALAAAPANENPGADDDWGENEAKGDDADVGGNANENKDEEDDGEDDKGRWPYGRYIPLSARSAGGGAGLRDTLSL